MSVFSTVGRFARPWTALCLAACWALSGCSFEHDPAKTVTIEIRGISDSADRERVQETLKGMTDGSSHLMTSNYSGEVMTVRLSPVTDVDAFQKKINFGQVTAVEDRTVKVDYVE